MQHEHRPENHGYPAHGVSFPVLTIMLNRVTRPRGQARTTACVGKNPPPVFQSQSIGQARSQRNRAPLPEERIQPGIFKPFSPAAQEIRAQAAIKNRA
jgi:hypothetical protein